MGTHGKNDGRKHPYCEPKQVQIDIPKQQKKMGKNPSFFIGGEDRIDVLENARAFFVEARLQRQKSKLYKLLAYASLFESRPNNKKKDG